MNNPILYQVGIGVFTLFFFFLMYMFAKTWRWPQITIMFFVYAASIAFVVYTSMTIRTHDAWRQLVRKQRTQVAQLTAEASKLTDGDLKVVYQTEPNLREIHSRLGIELLDRGRVWRNCQPAGAPAPDGTVLVNTSAPAPDGTPAAANQIQPETILYVFTENAVPPEVETSLNLPTGLRYPQYYVGEFTVTEATDTSVTIRPALPITNFERTMMSIPGVTWAMYESMPVDGHQLMAMDPHKVTDLTKNADEEPIFGDTDERTISLLMARAAKLNTETDEQFLQRYAENIQQYVRDGKRAASDGSDPPENMWTKVRFLEAHEEEVDSTASPGVDISTQDPEPFFDRGMAELESLKRGEPAKFKKGDVAVFPIQDATRLIDDGICEKIEDIFVRDLHNYDFALREIYRRVKKLEEDIAMVKRNTAKVTESNKMILAQIAYREQEKSKLEQDKTKFLYEQQQIARYADKLQKIFVSKRSELSRLYRSNYQLATELAKLHKAVAEQVAEREREAVASNP